MFKTAIHPETAKNTCWGIQPTAEKNTLAVTRHVKSEKPEGQEFLHIVQHCRRSIILKYMSKTNLGWL